MTRKAHANSGNGRLEEALAQLTQSQNAMTPQHNAMMQQQTALMRHQTALMEKQTALTNNQAVFNQNRATLLARLADLERQTAERFVRIEADIQAILRVLTDHSRLLQALPEAVRDKIGFKSPA